MQVEHIFLVSPGSQAPLLCSIVVLLLLNIHNLLTSLRWVVACEGRGNPSSSGMPGNGTGPTPALAQGTYQVAVGEGSHHLAGSRSQEEERRTRQEEEVGTHLQRDSSSCVFETRGSTVHTHSLPYLEAEAGRLRGTRQATRVRVYSRLNS